ncbi:MAG: ArsB/NhaD family transporter, partial [Bacilli bacterium]|nr:ArsB/NhaD family transporter [Bacilli bacterium]
NSLNPLKILVLFISVSLISIILDELNFFNYIAVKAVSLVKGSQYKLFFILYAIIAILTVFTSNDIIIITFTLFICYFTRAAKINPVPYLVMEFVVANTYSMMLYIGNPTNIYLASVFRIDFLEYFKIMIIPTLGAGLVSIIILLLLFNRQLKHRFNPPTPIRVTIKNKFLTFVALIILFSCTLLLALANYIQIEMWFIALLASLLLIIIVMVSDFMKKGQCIIKRSTQRAPWNLIFFVISMFTIVLSLNHHHVMENIATTLANFSANNPFKTILVYGVTSTITDNIINNIPMTLAYSYILPGLSSTLLPLGIYATIIGSNIGALLTPVGALAGIMWMTILKDQGIDFSFLKFTKYGFILTGSLLITSLFLLYVVI